MMGRTHALFGISALWLLYPLPNTLSAENIGPLAVVAAFGALLPDLDAAESTLKHLALVKVKPFVPLSLALHKSLGHRGVLHSLLGLGVVAMLFLPLGFWLGWTAWTAFILGCGSHLVADGLTKSGIPLLYPKRKKVHLLPSRWRFTTGSLAEEMLLPFLAFAVLLLVFSFLLPAQSF